MAKAIHMMVRVRDEAASVDFYGKALGLAVADRFDFDNFTLVYLRNDEADFEVELTINKGRETPYDLGDGYGHIAFVVDNLDEHYFRCQRHGLKPTPIKELAVEGLAARFFFIQDPDGYRIEILKRQGRFK
ncbi:MAG: VOC family protein [Bauldia sp.]|nr:VOC family protein [Bauldia sp.]